MAQRLKLGCIWTQICSFKTPLTVTFSFTQSSGTTTAANVQAIPFAQATANYNAQVTHIGVYDALTGGNLLFHGALTVPKTVTTGDTFQINAGALTITLE